MSIISLLIIIHYVKVIIIYYNIKASFFNIITIVGFFVEGLFLL